MNIKELPEITDEMSEEDFFAVDSVDGMRRVSAVTLAEAMNHIPDDYVSR